MQTFKCNECNRKQRFLTFKPAKNVWIKILRSLPSHNAFFFGLKAAVRRGHIKILLLKNISHLRELSHKFNQNYYVEFSKDLKITELLLQRSGTTHAL